MIFRKKVMSLNNFILWRLEILQPFLWFLKAATQIQHEYCVDLSDDKSNEILSILRKQMNDSAIAEETYNKVQNQLKLHQKIDDNVFDSEERFLYYLE